MKCGTEYQGDFCSNCRTKSKNEIGELTEEVSSGIIVKARVTYVFNGYGDLTLTKNALVWNKSATSYLAFGIWNALSSTHIKILLSDINSMNTYTYIPGGGLCIIDSDGKEHKFSFKYKKDFNVVHNFLKEYLKNKNI